ncbi:probable ATP-dependent RNA helicase ddx20 [Sabethes cyaneus]|uniref:probable ATP-dependent RNA helicase ddx20 n=1 Tax=Sabethes cyaneus TaxID=53552 RepID=UPI00237DB541|nr:probable ATP-dependent RNA helicase ddx20 [Sabethes cyaneus]
MAGHDLNDDRERSADVEFDRSLQFSSMFLSERVLAGLTRNNYIHPSPIQARAIPLGRLGIDLLVQAKSGTGKTLVFAVLIGEMYDPDTPFPQSLTIVPTREIAVQIEQVMNRICYSLPRFRAQSFIGGLDIAQDRKNLQNCSAVIGTPGRILHLMKNNILNTTEMRVLVLDEADSLISGTLQADVDHIIKLLPQKRQTIMCSATFYQNRDRKLLKYLNEKFIGVTPKKEAPILHGIRQFVRELPETKDNIKEVMGKIAELNQILKKIPYNQCLVFTNTQTKADTYRAYLNRAGWQAEVIRSGQEQRVRLKTVENLREFRCRILTATDLLARGIDAENVNLVINVDVPKDNSTYLHRIGRAGRFGTKGISITLLSSAKETERFRKILNDIGGTEMFLYKLPSTELEEIWDFDSYDKKYKKFFASSLEQEIRDRGADRSLLETIQEVDSRTEMERKSAEDLEDSLEEVKKSADSTLEADSIEQMTAKTENGLTTTNEEEEIIEKIIPLDSDATLEEIQMQSERPESISDVTKDCPLPVQPINLSAQTTNDAILSVAYLKSLQAQINSAENTVNKLEEIVNSAFNSYSDSSCCEECVTTHVLQFKDDDLQKITSNSNGDESSKMDQMFLAAMHKMQLADAGQSNTIKEESTESGKAYMPKYSSVIDQMFLKAMGDLEQQDLMKTEVTSSLEVKPELANDTAEHSLVTKQEGDASSELLLPTTNGELKNETVSSSDDLFLAAMNKIDFEGDTKPPPSDDLFLAAMNKIDTEEDTKPPPSDDLFLTAMNKIDSKVNTKPSPSDDLFLAAMNKIDSEEGTKPPPSDDLFLAAMNKIDFDDEAKPQQDIQDLTTRSVTPSSPEVTCSTPESCFTTDSSFSSNTTKKVEVGSDFTTPNSRVQGIRSAVPAHQVSSSVSDNSSNTSQTSDSVVPITDQSCLPLEVNNDALFAKIMEQKEMEVGHQQRPFQFSIDGCSLEVHDDPISDRDIDSRKGSVPDVVPCGITMDASRLHNDELASALDEQTTSGFDLNSNTCGSNHGSVFEHGEEAVIPQDDPPKRIRFQEDNLSLDLLANSENNFELEAQLDQQQDARLDLAPRTDAVAATEDIEDASSYSSEYGSEMSNSSFFDQREWDGEEAVSATVAGGHGKERRRSKSEYRRRSSARDADLTGLYHRTYANWSNQYWNQMTMIRDYTRFSIYTKRNICHNCQPKR